MNQLVLDHKEATFEEDSTTWHTSFMRPRQLGLLAIFSKPSIPARGINPTFGDEIRWRLVKTFKEDIISNRLGDQLRQQAAEIALQPGGNSDLDQGKEKKQIDGFDISGNINIKFGLPNRTRVLLLGFTAMSSLEKQTETWTAGDELRERLDRSFTADIKDTNGLMHGRFEPREQSLVIGNSSVVLKYGIPELQT